MYIAAGKGGGGVGSTINALSGLKLNFKKWMKCTYVDQCFKRRLHDENNFKGKFIHSLMLNVYSKKVMYSTTFLISAE